MITEKFIYSDEYKEEMFKYIEEDTDMFNLAQNSDSFWYRFEKIEYGAWRWFSMYQYRDIISEYVFSDMKGVDFGGYRGPIFGNTKIVDLKAECKSLYDLDEDYLDYIFSSHTLEHITEIDSTIESMYDTLKFGGKLILILPSHTCKRWNSDENFNTHVWDLYLSEDKNAKYYFEFESFIPIDTLIISNGFNIIKAEYCWDNNIFILAEKGENNGKIGRRRY
jgi:SAM-dependent methyltransferase